jgi:hypothetical protein
MLSPVETFDTVHLRLLSLALLDALLRFRKQVIIFILDKSKRRCSGWRGGT